LRCQQTKQSNNQPSANTAEVRGSCSARQLQREEAAAEEVVAVEVVAATMEAVAVAAAVVEVPADKTK